MKMNKLEDPGCPGRPRKYGVGQIIGMLAVVGNKRDTAVLLANGQRNTNHWMKRIDEAIENVRDTW